MSDVFEVPDSLVKAEQGLNTAMTELNDSIQEVNKLGKISELFTNAAEQNKETTKTFLETANWFKAETKSLMGAIGELVSEISESRKKADAAMADMRRLAIQAIVIQGAVVVIATLLGIYFLRR